MKHIKIFDTTLRDGEQSPGCKMTVEEKVMIAKKLEEMGVNIIEAGFAASSSNDKRAIEAIAKEVKKSTICSLARCKKEDIEIAYDSLKEAKYKRIHIFIATSKIHMKDKLKMTKEQVINKVVDSITFAKKYFDDIEFSCEDATRSDKDFLVQIIAKAIEMGATTINIPDTVGYMMPTEYYQLIKYIKNNVPNIDNVILSTHTHNDLGLAVATSLMGVIAGIEQIECTINGIGERAGNTALEEVIANLQTRQDYFQAQTTINSKMIYEVSNLVANVTNDKISRTKPIVGINAFKHESVIHQHGVINNAQTYEIMNPVDYGISTDGIVIGLHSGKSAIVKKIIDMHETPTNYDISTILNDIKKYLEFHEEISEDNLKEIIFSNKIKSKSLVINCEK